MNGKSKCKILKDIRKQIAAENDIAFVTSECKHQGDCSGTCPKCEAEVQYLENELRKRQAAGKAVAVAGIAATLMLGITACGSSEAPATDSTSASTSTSSSTSSTRVEVEGEFPSSETEPTTDDIELGGDPIWEEEEVMGDIALEDPFYEEEPGIDTGDWGELH